MARGSTETFTGKSMPATRWDDWAQCIDAAQDPAQRQAVEQFLGAAHLSAEFATALDANVLAPRRAAGATDEQCAYILCNLGFAALAASGTGASAEFALGCEQQAGKLSSASADLLLRRRFLRSKAGLVLASVVNQPHALWDYVAGQCTAYLAELERRHARLPPEAVTSHATAACSFAGQLLLRLEKMRALGVYAAEVLPLVEAALRIGDYLPANEVSRLCKTVMPGTDVQALLRRAGATAILQSADGAQADQALAWVADIPVRPGVDADTLGLLRAGLQLLAGRIPEAVRQAEELAPSSDPATRAAATLIAARGDLRDGNAQRAGERLATISPDRQDAIEQWCAVWMPEEAGARWTETGTAPPVDADVIWKFQAAAAADKDDSPASLRAADLAGGFLADSLLLDRQHWIQRLRDIQHRSSAYRDSPAALRSPSATPAAPAPVVKPLEPMAALEQIMDRLPAGSAVLQISDTGDGILTWIARRQDDGASVTIDSQRPAENRLFDLRSDWSRTGFHHPLAAPADTRPTTSAAFSRLMDEVQRLWGEPFGEWLDDGLGGLLVVGNDVTDIPLHAMPTGAGDERLIDRVPVSYAPSLTALRVCLDRPSCNPEARRGAALRSIVDPGNRAAVAEAAEIAGRLGVDSGLLDPVATEFWSGAATARVLQLVTEAAHSAARPLDAVLGPGALQLGCGELLAGLELPLCELVLNPGCESVHPSPLRAPGFDLSWLFLAAGARSILSSVWAPPGDLGAAVTGAFVEGWVAGLTPAAAFRNALIAVRADQPGVPDWHWAGMRLAGAP